MARKRAVRRVYRSVRRRVRRPKSFSIAVAGGLIAGVAGPADKAIHGDYIGGARDIIANYTGFSVPALGGDGFNLEYLKAGIVPLIIGAIVHKGVTMLGINRAFKNMPAPLNKISI